MAEAGADPPLHAAGGYSPAADGWLAHKDGQWLYNPEDKAYFHLPSGRLQLAPADGLLVQFVEPSGEAAATTEAPAVDAAADRAEAPAAPPAEVLRGTVRWFNVRKGFGFIEPARRKGIKEPATGGDIFFHRNQILEVEERLTKGDPVAFHLGTTEDGRQCAVQIRRHEVAEAGEPPAKKARVEGAEDDDMDEDASEEAYESGSEAEIDVFDELKSGVANEKGPKKERCEDFFIDKLKLPIGVLGESATCVVYAVMDGHNGSSCAEYATSHLGKNILSRLRDRPTGAKAVSDEVFLKSGLLGGFKQTEHNFLQHAKRLSDRAGSTACMVMVFGPDDEARLRLYMANLGDSRAVLGKVGGEAKRLTVDHKPELPLEKKRIEAAGGGVAQVAGIWRCMLPRTKISPILGLAVSRSFGDMDFKSPDMVSAEPEITIHEIDWDVDELIILASDGIWDVITDKEAVKIVQTAFREGESEEKAAQLLVAKALEKGTKDDRTALVVRLGWCKEAPKVAPKVPPQGAEGVAAMQAEGAQQAPGVGEDEDDENDPEVLAAIRGAMGLDDEEGEEEEQGEPDEVVDDPSAGSSSGPAAAAVAAASSSSGGGNKDVAPGALAAGTVASSSSSAAAAPAAAAPAEGLTPSAAASAASASASSSSSAPPAAAAGPAAASGSGPVAPQADRRAIELAAEIAELKAKLSNDSNEAGRSLGLAAPDSDDDSEDELDNIFAGDGGGGGERPEEKSAEAAGAAAGEGAAKPGGPVGMGLFDIDLPPPAEAAAVPSGSEQEEKPKGPVGMGLFDLDLPAPAEAEGPALVGPRKPGEE